MSETLWSAHWYRVRELRLRLRGHAEVERHVVRGAPWWVLRDRASGRHHRLSAGAWAIAGRLDGRHSVHQIWEAALEQLGDDGPTQDETLEILGRLHAADLLQGDLPPDGRELLERRDRYERAQRIGRIANPVAIRLPLLDPDRLLQRILPWVRPLFSRAGAAGWALLVGAACLLALAHTRELGENALDRIFAGQNLLLLAVVFPLVKLLHELGHGLATRVRGGEVHEAGVLLLALFPVPYIDCSAAAAFPRRRDRMLVGAAGIGVELAIAACALFAWLALEPGLLRSLCWNAMLVASVSTLLVNGNPLLKFDAYYVLADAIDVPNLGQRASRYVLAWLERNAFGLEEARGPETAPGEAAWLMGYGLASAVWRFIVLIAMALLVADRLPVIGMLIGAVAVTTQLGWPLLRGFRYLATSPRLGERRARALGASLAALALVGLLAFALPLPLRTRAEGVIWPPEHSQLRAGADGFVQHLYAAPGARVAAGAPLIALEDPLLAARVALLEARVAEWRARREAARRESPLDADLAETELETARAELARARERAASALLRAPASGIFVLPDAQGIEGRFLRQGELVGFVDDFAAPRARVALAQSELPLVTGRTRGIAVRLAERPGEVLAARVVRHVPGGGDQLPSAALGRPGGGPFAVDPSDAEGRTTLEPVFEVELALPEPVRSAGIGGRVHVRFDHGSEPLGFRGWRALRRLLLGRLGV